ncbi:uncharacterized protein METZ01_LOCUS134559, partial [marine metagenome]
VSKLLVLEPILCIGTGRDKSLFPSANLRFRPNSGSHSLFLLTLLLVTMALTILTTGCGNGIDKPDLPDDPVPTTKLPDDPVPT